MNLQTKSSLAKATLSLLTLVASVFLLGILVIVICNGFQINPFREATTIFLIYAFAGLIGVSMMLVILNIATNISLIADTKIAELKIEPQGRTLTKWGASFAAAAFILCALIFLGTYASKERFLMVVKSEADEVLKENNDLLESVNMLLASGTPDNYKRIHEIRDFLENQRSDFPKLRFIYSTNFEDKMAIYQISDYFNGDIDKNKYTHKYFKCTNNVDCSYLKRFFSGDDTGVLQKYTIRDDQFYIYIPHVGKASRFILLFDRRNSYGKFGS